MTKNTATNAAVGVAYAQPARRRRRLRPIRRRPDGAAAGGERDSGCVVGEWTLMSFPVVG
jgi:hypothetical protein